MRRTFPCGHAGKGRYCHRCQQAEQAQLARAQQKIQKVLAASQDPIDLSCLPSCHRDSARDLLRRAAAGAGIGELGGKRLQGQRDRVSVPLGHRWRLLLRDDGCRLHPVAALSHESYNRYC